MKVLNPNFKIPENPCTECLEVHDHCCPAYNKDCVDYHKYLGQQSILSQIRDVDLNKLYKEYFNLCKLSCPKQFTFEKCLECEVSNKSFEEFIKEKVE